MHYRYFVRTKSTIANEPVGRKVRVDEKGYFVPQFGTAVAVHQAALHGESEYWKEISEEEFSNDTFEMSGPNNQSGVNPEDEPIGDKEIHMSYQAAKIANVLMLNGSPAERYTDDDLISFVKSEQKAIEELKEVNVDSQHIRDRITKHEQSIAALVEILDTRKVDLLESAADDGEPATGD